MMSLFHHSIFFLHFPTIFSFYLLLPSLLYLLILSLFKHTILIIKNMPAAVGIAWTVFAIVVVVSFLTC